MLPRTKVAIASPRVYWRTSTHQCVLYYVGGVFELCLHHEGQPARTKICRDENDADSHALEWRMALQPPSLS
jgi:hypothetical protein